MTWLIVLPFVVQMSLMLVDEFYFHLKRGLPPWERWGHPIDTLTLLLGCGWLLANPPTPFSIKIYLGIAVFSCLFVTKDEWVHSRHCSPGEQWLHAVLFLVHPLVFLSLFLIWPNLHGETSTGYHHFIFIYFFATLAFCIYQIVAWNFFGNFFGKFLWIKRSTTNSTTL